MLFLPFQENNRFALYDGAFTHFLVSAALVKQLNLLLLPIGWLVSPYVDSILER